MPNLNHPNLSAITAQVESVFDSVADTMDAVKLNKHYPQLLETPADPPNGQQPAPFDPGRRPSGAAAGRDWTLIPGAPQGTSLAQVAVHEYLGPSGAGYVMIARLKWQNKTWRYVRHVGPESYRDAGTNTWNQED